MKYLKLLFLIFILILAKTSSNTYAQTIKVMAYNVFEFKNPQSLTKRNALKTIIDAVNPDIFVGVEIFDDLGSTGAGYFNTSVLSSTVPNEYDLASQTSPTNAYGLNPGNDDGKYSNFLYYKPGKFNFIASSVVVDDGKWPTLKYELYHPGTGNTLIIYGAHFTSGSAGSQRENEATDIRSSTASLLDTFFIAVGDFNTVDNSTEAAYVILTNPGTNKLIDPGAVPFTSSYFTFDATGSLSKRYDFIFNSTSVTSGGFVDYNGDFVVVGNSSGSTGTPYSTASDHLPVYATYTFNSPTPVELVSFTGKLNRDIVDLNWKTETEVNNYGFSIERSSTSLENDWETIGFVEGNGNSNSPKYYKYTDNDIQKSGTYSYRLKQTDNDGTFEYSKVVSVEVSMPGRYNLSQNYPNPFNPETKIDFTIPEKQMVTLRIYNTLGEKVAELLNEEKDAGNYSVSFNASNLPSGIYIYRLITQKSALNKKMTLLR